MTNLKILITGATGKTGSAAAQQLLKKGYPVRAFVRRADNRSEKLRQQGAEIVVGNLDDIIDVRRALDGVQRAYFCPPWTSGSVATSMIFASAAQEYKLESVTVMSQWLADPTNPSLHTRETWLTDTLFSWMPNVGSVIVNPGWFADNYLVAGLDMIAQLGMMVMPLGEGLNAPPSNEDIARVIVGTLINPVLHIGKTYRPTGPKLLSPPQMADVFGRVLGRKVKYQDAPMWLFSKVARSVGLPDFQTAQVMWYLEEYRQNAFGVGAPTNAVLEVGGQEPEDFETIVRRYVATAPNMKRNVSDFSRTLLNLMKIMLAPTLNVDRFACAHDFPRISNMRLAVDSPEWRVTHI